MTFRVLLFACILLFALFLAIIGISIFSQDQEQEPNITTTAQVPTGGLIPTAPPEAKTPDVSYSKVGTEKLLEIVKNRPTPSTVSDVEIRQALTALVGEDGGVLYQSPLVKISYVPAPNDFEAEILTSNIQAGKDEAVDWLRDRGFTEDGICKLPLFFYLSIQAKSEIKKTGQSFNPIPDFCI